MKKAFHPVAAVAVLATLGGCASDVTGYPSLAPRKIEQDARDTPAAVEPEAPVAVPAGTSPALARIGEQAAAADAVFRDELERSRKAIEAGGRAAAGSEAWIAGQQAFSALDALRGPVTDALAQLDRLRQEAVSQGEDESPITAVTMRVQAIDEAERAALAQLALPGA